MEYALRKRAKASAVTKKSYASNLFRNKLTGDAITVVYEELSSVGLYFVNGFPLWSSIDTRIGGASIVYFRGTIAFEDLLILAADNEASIDWLQEQHSVKTIRGTYRPGSLSGGLTVGIDENNEHAVPHSSTTAYTKLPSNLRAISIDSELIGVSPMSSLSMDELQLPPAAVKLCDAFEDWLKSKQWFRERHMPWKFSALLHGTAGTGKTSLIRALAAKHGLPVHVMDLSTMYNHELSKAWQEAQALAPCVVVIEDIHRIFRGGDPVNEHIVVTIDALLQCLSGMEESSGTAVFVTTNDVSTLDEALSRRSRLDHHVYLGGLSAQGATNIANRVLEGLVDDTSAIAKLLEFRPGAYAQFVCVRIAQLIRLGFTVEEAIKEADEEAHASLTDPNRQVR
jgi:hypothetical protein